MCTLERSDFARLGLEGMHRLLHQLGFFLCVALPPLLGNERLERTCFVLGTNRVLQCAHVAAQQRELVAHLVEVVLARVVATLELTLLGVHELEQRLHVGHLLRRHGALHFELRGTRAQLREFGASRAGLARGVVEGASCSGELALALAERIVEALGAELELFARAGELREFGAQHFKVLFEAHCTRSGLMARTALALQLLHQCRLSGLTLTLHALERG
jgi:hypothetical protein